MFRDAKAGFQHTIPLSTNFKLFKHLSMSTSTNFKENSCIAQTKPAHIKAIYEASQNHKPRQLKHT